MRKLENLNASFYGYCNTEDEIAILAQVKLTTVEEGFKQDENKNLVPNSIVEIFEFGIDMESVPNLISALQTVYLECDKFKNKLIPANVSKSDLPGGQNGTIG